MASWLSNDTVLVDGSCPLPLDLPFTAAMAAPLGVSRGQLRRLVARGLVRRVCQGVYAVAQLNNRPRERHGFRTPAEVLEQLLSQATTNHGVA